MECSTWGFNKQLKSEVCNRNLFQVPAERGSVVLPAMKSFLCLLSWSSWGCSGTWTALEREEGVLGMGATGAGMFILKARGLPGLVCAAVRKPRGSSCEQRLSCDSWTTVPRWIRPGKNSLAFLREGKVRWHTANAGPRDGNTVWGRGWRTGEEISWKTKEVKMRN